MLVIVCLDCYKLNFQSCKKCITEQLQQVSSNGTSGNEFIDKFIQINQLYRIYKLEWFPYNRFENIKYNGKKKSNSIYSAIRLDGQLYYDHDKRKWCRYNKSEVILKSLNKSLTLNE